MKLGVHNLLCVVFIVSCSSKENKLMNPQYNYSIIWKYKIKPENKEKFEYEYGPTGTWFKLFSKSGSYTGSFLNRMEEEDNVYILIDTWWDKESYENFMEKNREVYNRLSAQFENLYEQEEKIGSFDLVK
jgi:hypothetical protein